MPNVPKFNTRYTYKRVPGVLFDPENNPDDVSLTQQSFGFETDINAIVKGMVPTNFNPKTPIFESSFSPDMYEEALNIIANASSQFEELPSSLRKEFNNDPKQLLAFLDNPKNYDRAVELGLIERKTSEVIINPSLDKNPTEVTTKPTGEVVNSTSPN